MSFNITFSDNDTFNIGFGSDGGALDVDFGSTTVVPVADYYDGSYVVTPSTEAQVLPTMDLAMRRDLVVEAIPSYYGLITWNGAVLTVS